MSSKITEDVEVSTDVHDPALEVHVHGPTVVELDQLGEGTVELPGLLVVVGVGPEVEVLEVQDLLRDVRGRYPRRPLVLPGYLTCTC